MKAFDKGWKSNSVITCSDRLEMMTGLSQAFSKRWNVLALQTFFRQGVKEHESLRQRLEEQFGNHLLRSARNDDGLEPGFLETLERARAPNLFPSRCQGT